MNQPSQLLKSMTIIEKLCYQSNFPRMEVPIRVPEDFRITRRYQVTCVEGVQNAMNIIRIDLLILRGKKTKLSSFYRWWIWITGFKVACSRVYSTLVTGYASQPNSGSGAFDPNHCFPLRTHAFMLETGKRVIYQLPYPQGKKKPHKTAAI